jgi:hypothetical protein
VDEVDSRWALSYQAGNHLHSKLRFIQEKIGSQKASSHGATAFIFFGGVEPARL